MSASDDPRRVHFQSPEYLVDRLDAIADLFDKDRTDLLVDAIREYIEDTADSETFQELVATKYYDDQLEFETVKQLVGRDRPATPPPQSRSRGRTTRSRYPQ